MEKQGFIDFISREKNKLLHFIRKNLKGMNYVEPEDILQDIILNILSKETDYVDNVPAYFYTAIRNRIIDLFRKKKEVYNLDEEYEDTEERFIDFIADDKVDIEKIIEGREFQNMLFYCLSEMKDEMKDVWVETELNGRSYQELSDEWEIPIGTLLSRKHRANNELKNAFNEYMNE
jgi:RNA polymerase sigma factor (sigma-70 family)